MNNISKIRQSNFDLHFFRTENCVSTKSVLLKVPPDSRVLVFVNALVQMSGGVCDIFCVAPITFKFVNHALIVDNSGLLLFWSENLANLLIIIYYYSFKIFPRF